jgi:hypothetical protein
MNLVLVFQQKKVALISNIIFTFDIIKLKRVKIKLKNKFIRNFLIKKLKWNQFDDN